MGNVLGYTWQHYVSERGIAPADDFDPTFDPKLGFPAGRKDRAMPLPLKQVQAAAIQDYNRTYCVKEVMDYWKCRRDSYYRMYPCRNYRHIWEECEENEFIMRQKEYERERRLRLREKRKREQQRMIEINTKEADD